MHASLSSPATAAAHSSSPASPGVGGALQRVVSGLHWLRIAHAERRRRAHERQELSQLVEPSLRDLDLTRGELDSYAAHARGVVARTRVQVDQAQRGSL